MERSEELLETIRRALVALGDAEVTYSVVGAAALAVHGLPRPARWADVLVRPRDAEKAISALRRARLRADTPTHGEDGGPSPHMIFANDTMGTAISVRLALAEPERGFCEDAKVTRVFGTIGRVATLEQLLVLAHLRPEPDAALDDFASIVRSKRVDLSRAGRMVAAVSRESVPEFEAKVKAAQVPVRRWRNRFQRQT